MTLILDSGAFLAVENADRDTIALLKIELHAGRIPRTHGGVVGQVWRGGSGRQAPVAKLLGGTDVIALGEGLGRQAGILLGLAKQRDVVDAAIVLLAQDGDTILTSDPGDLEELAAHAGVHADLVSV